MNAEFIQKYWLIGFFILAIIFYIFGFAGYLVQEDAKKRGMNLAAVTFWSVGTVFLGLLFLPLYLLFRSSAIFTSDIQEEAKKPDIIILCPHCGTENPHDQKICLGCKRRMDIDLPSMGKKACPYCGTENNVEADRCSECGQVIGFADE
jgi:uncharacterized Zn-finger protein